jgi:50S ribosomal protein L16 3-hydroxylase
VILGENGGCTLGRYLFGGVLETLLVTQKGLKTPKNVLLLAIMKPGLAALIYPHSVSQFLEDSWPTKPFAVHGLGKSVRPLTDLPFLQSIDELLKRWPQLVQVHLPDLSDEASAVDASPRDAKKLFANRMGLLFNHIHKLSPVLDEWLTAIAGDLGLPALTYSRCMAYATPDGKGTAAHFDQNINFVLQLHGTKKWWLAPNEHVQNPTQRHTASLPLDPELKAYARTPMPKKMPAGSREIILKPGSMLFVPRGWWHSTEAKGEALALNFTYSQPTWIDLFTAALRTRLSLSEEWRELADGVSSKDPTRRETASQKFDALLLELVGDLPNWRAEDILAVTEGK